MPSHWRWTYASGSFLLPGAPPGPHSSAVNSESESHSVVSNSLRLVDYTVLGILQARILEWVAFPLSRESSQPRCPTLQVDSLPVEPQGKPKNTGVGSLSLLQQIFPTQELNRGLLHCRWILYQLSYQGSPSSESWRKILPAGGRERTTLKCARDFCSSQQGLL